MSLSAAWMRVLLSNWWLPLLVLLLPAARFIENEDKVSSYHVDVLLRIGTVIVAAVSLQLINGISGQFSLGHAGFMAIGAYAAGYAVQNFSSIPIATDDPSIPRYTNPVGVLLFFFAFMLSVGAAAAILSFCIMGIRKLRYRLGSTIPTILGFVFIAWILTDIILYARSGQFENYSLWSRLLIALVKMYALLTTHGVTPANWISTHLLPESFRQPLTMLFALIGAGTLAGTAGWIVGLPTLRLRGDYLAIATLGFAEIIRIVLTNAGSVGGATGLQVVPYPIPPDPDPQLPVVGHYILPWVFGAAILTITLIWRLKHSPKGRAIQAVREDEIAARAVGIDNVHHKVISFIIGAFFAGVAGGLVVTRVGYVNPNNFDFSASVDLVVIVTLGGLGSIWGTVLAAIILTALPQVLQSPKEWLEFLLLPFGGKALNISPSAADWLKWVGDNRMVLYAILLIGLMLLKYGDFSVWLPRRKPRRPRLRKLPAQPAV